MFVSLLYFCSDFLIQQLIKVYGHNPDLMTCAKVSRILEFRLQRYSDRARIFRGRGNIKILVPTAQSHGLPTGMIHLKVSVIIAY